MTANRGDEVMQPAEDPIPTSEPPPTADEAAVAATATVEQVVAPAPVPVDDPAAVTFVYALGRIEPRFPTLSIEKEFAQVAGGSEMAGLTDRQATRSVLAERSHRYLARQMCWVLTIEGIEAYILAPRADADAELLLDTLRTEPRRTDVDAVVGVLGPIAPPEACNNLMVPIVFFDQLYSFDVDSLVKAIPKPKGMRGEQFEAAAEEVFDRIMLMADNAGATDEHRALNYLALRYPGIYHTAAERFAANASLTAVTVEPSPLPTTRKVLEVVFTFTNRDTDVVDKVAVRVDVTEEFPFLVSKLSPYIDRR
jgi:hypothetical protein